MEQGAASCPLWMTLDFHFPADIGSHIISANYEFDGPEGASGGGVQLRESGDTTPITVRFTRASTRDFSLSPDLMFCLADGDALTLHLLAAAGTEAPQTQIAMARVTAADFEGGPNILVRTGPPRGEAPGARWVGVRPGVENSAVEVPAWGGIDLIPQIDLSPPTVPLIESIVVNGLRGFASEQVVNLAIPDGQRGSGLTLVVGPNNAGKSTIWEALSVLAKVRRGFTSFPESRRNSMVGIVEVRAKRSDGSRVIVRSLKQNSSQVTEDAPDDLNVMVGSDPWIIVVPSRRQFQSFFSNLRAEADWMSQTGNFLKSSSRDEFAGRLIAIQEDEKRLTEFNALLHKVLGHPVDWTIDEREDGHGNTHFVRVSGTSGSHHTSEGLGDGVTSLMFVLSALLDSIPARLVALDEPELSLHPQAVRRLGNLIADYAADRQIVVCTHSPSLVDWDSIANGATVVRVHATDFGSVASQPSPETLRTAAALRRARNRFNPHTLGTEANEVFFLEDAVVLVEGQEDVIYLPRVLDSLGVELGGTIFGWGAGGAQNVPALAQLLAELGLRRIVVILDSDVTDAAQKVRTQCPECLVLEWPAADIRTKLAVERKEKVGLLDSSNQKVRLEHVDEARSTIERANAFLSGSSAQ